MRQPLEDAWPYGLECDHGGALADLWEQDDSAGLDPERPGSAYLTLDEEPKQFTDEVAEVSVTRITGGARVAWTCPVCGERHEDEHDASDFADDAREDD